MFSSLSLWLLAASLGQAPAPPAWLKAVPADVDVAVRVRGVDAARADVSAMIKAFSPALAERAEPMLDQGVAAFRQQFGEPAAATPWVGLLRLEGAQQGDMPFAILVLEGEQAKVLASINDGKAPELKDEDGGVSSFERQGQGGWYTAKGPGCVAFGRDKALIAAVARPQKALDSVLTADAAAELAKGDVGLYVNASALVQRYWGQIDGARQAFMTALDQPGQQAGNAASMDAAKDIYNAMFDALKDGDAFVLSADASARGLTLGGALTAKADSKAAGAFAKLATGAGAGMEKLPADAAYFLSMNIDSSTLDRMMNANLRMVNADKKPSPEQQAALAKLGTFGRVESLGSVKMAGGMSMLNVTKVDVPAAFLEATQAVQKSFKGGGAGGLIKEMTTEPVAEPFRGIRLTHAVTKLDFEKFAEQNQNNPAAAESMKTMFPGGEMNAWSGTDGKLVYQVTGRNWDEAKVALGAFLDGKGGIGESASFKELRAALPEAATVSVLISAQGAVNMFATSIAAAVKRPELKAGEVPAEPALFGMAAAPQGPRGVSFRLVVPAAVGPVFEKGLVPLFKAMQPPGND